MPNLMDVYRPRLLPADTAAARPPAMKEAAPAPPARAAGASDGGPAVPRADAFGNTTGELITRWLRRG